MTNPEITINKDWFHQYYFHSDLLFGIPCPGRKDIGHFDPQGIPIVHYKWEGRQYNPAYVAWWGLVNLNFGTDALKAAIDWLHTHAVKRHDGVVWEYAFNWVEGHAYLKAPWISAMAQGLAISALIRSWRWFGNSVDLDLAVKASVGFWIDIENGGVRDRSDGLMFLEEYPARPYPRVLDGFCFALLSLNDLKEELKGDDPYRKLLDQGLDTLETYLPCLNFMNVWSWYGRQGFLSSTQYHSLNRVMLKVLHQISNRKTLHLFYEKWNRSNLHLWEKAMIRIFKKYTLAFRRRQYNRIRRMLIRNGSYLGSSSPQLSVGREDAGRYEDLSPLL